MTSINEPSFGLTGQRAVLVASTGGHLAELARLRAQLDIAPDPLWITFEHPQATSMLAGERVFYVPYVAPRDVRGVLRATQLIRGRLADEQFEVAVSTGAGIALSALPFVRKHRRAIYVESVSRFEGPSLTGRMLSRLRHVELFTQHEAWASERWRYAFSLLDGYRPHPRPETTSMRVFVSLGTIRPYRFDALVDAVRAKAGPGAEIVWQLGSTTRDDLPGRVFETLDSDGIDREIRSADVIVAHAGVGSALRALEHGRVPILVPRRAGRGEHVDDHQAQIAAALARRGLAMSVEADDLQETHLREARTLGVVDVNTGGTEHG
jgi:UDP-N-acetylglucosamine transferase subunit ALG13